MNAITYPLVFSFRDAIVGNGFVAYVGASGRVLLTNEGDGDIWMFGVQPGGVAGGGNERSEAFREFKKSYLSVLFDIASTSSSYEDFEDSVKLFFSEVNAPNLAIWTDAVDAVRSGKLSPLPDLKATNADTCPPRLEIRRIDMLARANDNSFDEIRKAAQAAVSSSGTIALSKIWAMLEHCAPGHRSTGTPASADERSGPRPGSFKDRFIKFIEANPGCDYATMAKAIYGDEDEGSRNKARSTVHVLATKDKIIESVMPGRWRIAKS